MPDRPARTARGDLARPLQARRSQALNTDPRVARRRRRWTGRQRRSWYKSRLRYRGRPHDWCNRSRHRARRAGPRRGRRGDVRRCRRQGLSRCVGRGLSGCHARGGRNGRRRRDLAFSGGSGFSHGIGVCRSNGTALTHVPGIERVTPSEEYGTQALSDFGEAQGSRAKVSYLHL